MVDAPLQDLPEGLLGHMGWGRGPVICCAQRRAEERSRDLGPLALGLGRASGGEPSE